MMMRAGPLSDDRVVTLLNHYFVPVLTSNEDYNKAGAAKDAEKAERLRIARAAMQVESKDPLAVTPDSHAADVACYILSPRGEVIATLRLPECAVADKVVAFLEKAVAQLAVEQGPPLVEPKPLLVTPPSEAGQLVLHLTTRYLATDASRRLWAPGESGGLDRWMALIGNRLRAVSLLPSENWIVLDKEDWSRLLAPADASVGHTWDVSDKLGPKLFGSFYPPSTNNEPAKNQILAKSLRATLMSSPDGKARVRLEGRVRIKHPFLLFQDDDYHVEAQVFGYVDYDAAARRIRVVKLVSEQGTYAGGSFGAAIRLLPRSR